MKKQWPLDTAVSFDPYQGEPGRDGDQGYEIHEDGTVTIRIKAPFAKEAELAEKSARLKELNILLNMDQKDRSVLDEGPEEDAPKKEKRREQER